MDDTCRKGDRIRTVVEVSTRFHLVVYRDETTGKKRQVRWPSWWSWAFDGNYVEA